MSFDYFSKRRMQYFLEKLKVIFDTKVDKVSGKGLSTNDYTTTEKNKLAGIAAGAEVNVQSDWNQTTTTAKDYIKNKPTSKAAASGGTDLSLVTTGEKYTWNNKGNGTVTQVKVGSTAYNPSSGVISLPAYPTDTNTHRPIQMNGTEILGNNTTALNLKAGSNVSLSNSGGTVTIAATNTTYGVVSKTANGLAPQLPNETTTTKFLRQDGSWAVPAYPTVNNGTLTIQKNGTNVQTFTANQSSNATANITVPTKVSELTNDSGYTKNTGTVTSIATGTGLTGGTITGSGTISIANHSADYLAGGYINIHPENSPTLIPFMNNDIAYLLKRGGSAVVKYDGTQQSVDLTNCFDGSPSYWAIDPTGKTTITIELVLHKVFTWTSTIYCDFGSAGWRAKNVKIEVINTNYTSDVWTQKYANTNLGLGHFYANFNHTPVGASNAGGGFNRIRFTFSSWNSATIFRIAQLGVYNYSSAGLRETFLPKDGGNIYGTIYPNSNNGANLGTTSNYFNNAYITNINGVAVGSSPKFTDTNTWRGIQDNLTSDSTTESLSAKQGKNLANGSARDSTKLPLAGGTMTGIINGTANSAQFNARPNHANFDGVMSYQTAGNEAWLFTTKNAVTSMMFVNGEDTITNIANSRWQSLTPGLQIKNNCVAIGKLIPNNTTPTHKLDVNGNIQTTSLNGVTVGSNPKFTDTTYSSKSAASGGTDVSLVTTGEKYTWNNKGNGTVTQVKVGSTAYNPSSGVISLPAYPTNTDSKVTQENSIASADYRVLLSGTADDTTKTEGSYKCNKLIFNPNNGGLVNKYINSGATGNVTASGIGSSAFGCVYSGSYSIQATGRGAHAEGYVQSDYGKSITATNYGSHAEGCSTTSSGIGSHCEGGGGTASGTYAHCEGGSGNATGQASHVEGTSCQATASNAHAEGRSVVVNGACSHGEGVGITVPRANMHVRGNTETKKFATTSISTKGDGYVYGEEHFAKVWAADGTIDGSYGSSGEITGTATVTINCQTFGMYLLCVSSFNASTGAFYGNTVRFVTINATANSNVLNLGQSTNAPCTITAMQGGVKLKNTSNTYVTEYTLIRVA